MTKLTGRYIEIEMMPLNFYEYIDMKKFYEKQINPNIYKEFEEYIKNGGFPGALFYDDYEDKMTYITNVINKNNKIRNIETFELIQKYVINNFGTIISVKKIYEYFKNEQKINIDRKTIKRNIEILEKAKIIYPCELFDIKSKNVLKGEKKYYLADFSIYYALNTDNRINYGPMLENIIYIYLKSKNYKLSVGRIGKLECDFIARKGFDKYFYIQISKTIEEDRVEKREYKPFYYIKDMYPRYLFTMDLLLQNKDGVNNVNIADFISENKEL